VSGWPAFKMKKTLWLISAYVLLLNSFLFYGFIRDATWFALAALSIFLPLKIGWKSFTLFAYSFSFATFLMVFVMSFFSGLIARPLEQLTVFDEDGIGRFRKSQSITVLQPFGDIAALAQGQGTFEREERKVVFNTDALGFRNSENYHGQRTLLVGDSFIAGLGTTQQELVSEHLKHYGRDVYNLAHPADIIGYVHYLKRFRAKYGASAKALLFLYEGNDFLPRKGINRWSDVRRFKQIYKRWLRLYKGHFHDTVMYRFTAIFYYKAKAWLNEREPAWNEYVIGNRKIAILKSNIAVTSRLSFEGSPYQEELLQEVADMLQGIVFIPTKYRVYVREAVNKDPADLPDVQWRYVQSLAKKLRLPCINLTESLRAEAQEQLARDKLVFWADDTHWNGRGMKAAASAIAGFLNEIEKGAQSLTEVE